MSSLNRVQLIGRLPKDFKQSRIDDKFVLSFDLNVESEYESFFPISTSGNLALYCRDNWKEGCLIYLEGKLYVFDKDPNGTYLIQIIAHKVNFLEHKPLTKYSSTNADAIYFVIKNLEVMALDPSADHASILRIIKELNSLAPDDY